MSITDELREWFECYTMRKDVYDELTAIADRIDAEHEAMLADARKTVYQGYIELPKDADGEYIHVGDVMDTEHFGTVEVEGFVHNAVAFYNYSGQPAYLCTSPANLCRHYHEPTVEGLLCELLDKVDDDRAGQAEIIAEYAARLQLKEGA